MKDEGYIMLPRSIIDDDYFAQKFTRAQALIDLYMLAAYKERAFTIRGNVVALQRGQVAVSENSLATRWGWSRNTVRKYIAELVNSGKIAQQKSRVINVITLNSYSVGAQQNEQQIAQQNEQPINNIIIKEKYKRNNKRKMEAQFLETIPVEFRDLLAEWLDYKRQRGEKPYTEPGLKLCYAKLLKLSGNNAATAKEIIEQSISNNYAGLFPLQKINRDGNKNNRPTAADNIFAAQAAHMRQLAASVTKTADRKGEVFAKLPFD